MVRAEEDISAQWELLEQREEELSRTQLKREAQAALEQLEEQFQCPLYVFIVLESSYPSNLLYSPWFSCYEIMCVFALSPTISVSANSTAGHIPIPSPLRNVDILSALYAH